MIYNAMPMNVTADVTSPNGSVKTYKFDAISNSPSSQSQFYSPGVNTLKISIASDTGTALFSGTVGRDDVQLIVPTAKGAKLVYGGLYSESGSPKAAAFMNLTGEPMTIDLEGGNGLGAHRGITPSAELDLKKLTSLDSRESSFTVLLKVKGKDPIKLDSSKVIPGGTYLVYKDTVGAYRLTRLGYLPAVKKK